MHDLERWYRDGVDAVCLWHDGAAEISHCCLLRWGLVLFHQAFAKVPAKLETFGVTWWPEARFF